MKRLLTIWVALWVITASASIVQAEGFALSDFGARGTSLAGGMVGRADDPSAIAWNPAGITQLPGMQTMAGFTMLTPMGTVDTVSKGVTTSTDVKRNYWFNPHAYLTYQLNDTVWLGLGLFSRYGLGNSYPSDWPGKQNLADVSLQTITLNPNLAFKVNSNLSLAIGVDIMGASMKMHKYSPMITAAGLDYNKQKMDGMSVALGVNLAAHYKFNEQWAAGLTYRSRVQQPVKGKSSFEVQTTAVPSRGIPAYLDSDLRGSLSLPEVYSFGVMYKPVHDLSFELGTVLTRWSQYKSLNIYLEDPMNYAALNPKDWKDSWAFNVSVEYQYNPNITLRGGYIYETSPMNMDTVDYMTPSDGRQRFTTGIGFNWDNWTVDLAYAYLMIKKLSYDQSSKHTSGILAGSSRNGNAHIVAASVGYKF